MRTAFARDIYWLTEQACWAASMLSRPGHHRMPIHAVARHAPAQLALQRHDAKSNPTAKPMAPGEFVYKCVGSRLLGAGVVGQLQVPSHACHMHQQLSNEKDRPDPCRQGATAPIKAPLETVPLASGPWETWRTSGATLVCWS